MRPAEFEEKDFEGPLYNQLLAGSSNLATPGQVFEGNFGIDAALEAQHPFFWSLFGYQRLPTGIVLADFDWPWIRRRTRKPRPLPGFAINLLVQAKRPQRLNGINAALSQQGIKGSYWRFAIDQKQHGLIRNIATTLGNRALIVYASTAFDTFDELYEHTEASTMVENCSYVRVGRLSGHEQWNYDQPGTRGVAWSKPEAIDEPPLETQIAHLAENGQSGAAVEELEGLYTSVLSVLRENAQENAVAAYILRHHEAATAALAAAGIERREILPFVTLVNAFGQLNLDWFVAGRDIADSKMPAATQ